MCSYHENTRFCVPTTMIEILQQLGLSPNEAKIYSSLLDLKEAGVGKISIKAEIHRRNTYDAINRLIDKGLIFPIISKGENLYAPVDPDKLKELIKEKETSLNNILPNLRERFKKPATSQEAYIYRGVEGYKNYMRDLLRVGQDAYYIGAKMGSQDPRLETFRKRFDKEIQRKNINLYHLFDAEIKQKAPEAVQRLKDLGQHIRFLPEKYSTDSGIDIFGDYVVTFTGLHFQKFDDDVTLFVLHDKKLAESYKTWFKFMFESCEE